MFDDNGNSGHPPHKVQSKMQVGLLFDNDDDSDHVAWCNNIPYSLAI